MASGAALQRLQSRAAQAEQLITLLRTQLETQRKNAAVTICKAEEEKLSGENAVLRREVEGLKKRLIQAEINNGVKQVPLPPKQGNVSQTAAPKQEKPAAAPNKKDAKNAENKNTEKKQQNKKGGGGGGKGGKPAEEAKPINVSRLNMKVGKIVDVKRHPDADSLYVETVELGEDRPRTIVSGLVKHVPIEQMQDRLAIFMVNLKPNKLRGILSEGMIMCGSTPEKVEIIVPPEGASVGDQVKVEGYPGEPDDLLNPKKKIWEQIQPDLTINTEGQATYKGALWDLAGKGECTVPTMRGTPIK